MHIGKTILAGLSTAAALLAAAPAQAEILTFHSRLDGNHGAEPTGSKATAKTRINVDTDRQLVSVDMIVDGITTDDLWDRLVEAPIGPIHFHKYANAAGGDSVLVLPLPYGANYQPTERGLHVTMKDYDYAAGAKLLKSTLTFDQFVEALKSGLVILNVHTDAFNPGEISGRVTG
jgi:hypothetical protein